MTTYQPEAYEKKSNGKRTGTIANEGMNSGLPGIACGWMGGRIRDNAE